MYLLFRSLLEQNNEKKICMYEREKKFMHSNIELKIVCKSKIVSLQLFLKNIIIVLVSNVLR